MSVVAGSHTHVPTADQRILPGGTAYVGHAQLWQVAIYLILIAAYVILHDARVKERVFLLYKKMIKRKAGGRIKKRSAGGFCSLSVYLRKSCLVRKYWEMDGKDNKSKDNKSKDGLLFQMRLIVIRNSLIIAGLFILFSRPQIALKISFLLHVSIEGDKCLHLQLQNP